MLSEMVFAYFQYMRSNTEVNDELWSFLESSYLTLKKEFRFWMDESSGHVVNVTVPGEEGGKCNYRLNRYFSAENSPRPESYAEDYVTAGGNEDAEADDLFKQIRAGAESGWDFSSRWIRPDSNSSGNYSYSNLRSIHTQEIIPVDLNAIMYRFELNIAEIANILLASASSAIPSAVLKDDIVTFQGFAESRREGMRALLWDNSTAMYRDMNMTSGSRSTETTISNFVAFWAGLVQTEDASRAYESFLESGLSQAGGLLTTLLETGQQWDAPNAWAPCVHLVIEGLRNLEISDAIITANQIKSTWLNTCYLAYNETGYMYEKYNAYEIGEGGDGGEYTPQIGFGWSNGMIHFTFSSMSHALQCFNCVIQLDL